MSWNQPLSNTSIRRIDFAHFKAMQRGSARLRDAVLRARHMPLAKPPRVKVHLPARPEGMPEAVRQIVLAIAEDMDVGVGDIMGRDRHPDVWNARMVAYVVLTKRCGSMAQVGRWLGGKDHTSVRQGVMKFQEQATPRMRQIVERYSERKAA